MFNRIRTVLALCALTLAFALPGAVQAAQGKLEKIRVHGPSLEGNLQGNDATRDVWVYLPPDYDKSSRRYPVIYFLHGYAVTADIYVNDVLKIPGATDEALKAPDATAVKKQLDRLTDKTLKSEPRSSDNGMESQASAWAPNPQNPPWYFDLPFDAAGNAVPRVADKWTANSVLVTVDQNVPALKSFRSIMMDVGDQDGLNTSNREFSDALTRLGVAHEFEVYEGTHGNRVGARFIANVLPFFAKYLDKK